jgi:hypothetical protein
MTFYQNIFSAPASVEGNFIYYFGGIIGGSFLKLFPDSGIIGIRVLGVINNMAIIYLTYRLLKNHIDDLALFIGLFIVTISFHGMPFEFFHNPLSILLFISSASALFFGLTRGKYIYIAFSGTFVALNTFTRLPNVLDLGLIFIIIVHFIIYKAKTNTLVKNCLAFLVSFTLSVAIILVLMKLLGHLAFYMNALHDIRNVALDNKSSHGLISLLKINYLSYARLYHPAAIILFILTMLAIAENVIKNRYILWIFRLLLSLLLWRSLLKIENVSILYIVSLTALVLIIWSNKTDKCLKLLSWIALFMIVVMPFGSNYALGNFGWFTCWISVPIAVSFIMRLFGQCFDVSLIINDRTEKVQFIGWKVKSAFVIFLLVFTLTCFQEIISNGCYFDAGSRFKKTWSINNDKAKYIFTTRARSKVINDVLAGIKPNLRNGECLFIFDSSPMLNYLTETRPFAGMSWPAGCDADVLKDKLEKAKVKDGLPMVLRQKFWSVGVDVWKPSNTYLVDCGSEDGDLNTNKKVKVVNYFLLKYDYKELWSNDYYVLLAPVKM